VCRHTAKGKEELERSEEQTAEGLHQHRFVTAKAGRGMKWQESSGPCAKVEAWMRQERSSIDFVTAKAGRDM